MSPGASSASRGPSGLAARRAARRLLALALALCGLSVAVRAQVDPAADFSTRWLASAEPAVDGGARAVTFGVIVTSARPVASALDFRLTLEKRGAAGAGVAGSSESGIVVVAAGGTDTAGQLRVRLDPGDRIEARIALTHVQEGFTVRDSLLRTFGRPAARVADPDVADDPNDLEIDGLVIDRTLTKSGQDFYGLFYQKWQPPFGARGYSVTLEESPFRGRQTLIKVSLDEQLLYQRVLQPRYDVLEEMAGQAVATLTGALTRRTRSEQSRDVEAGEHIERF